MADQGADATPAQALIAKLRLLGKAAQTGYPANFAEQIWDIADELEAALAVSPQGWPEEKKDAK